MPDSQNPQTPNFVPGVGRLVTDRYDFEAHVEGTAFRHNANQIDLFPTLVIENTTCTTVQQALNELTQFIVAPTVSPATYTSLGTIQLAGDLYVPGSTATNPKVGGLQGYPVSTLPPTDGQVLTFNAGAWGPAAPSGFIPSHDLSGSLTSQTVIGIQGNPVPPPTGTNTVLQWNGSFSWSTLSAFSAGGDLTGSNTSQQVIALTGSGSHPVQTVTAHNDLIKFDANTVPYITQSYVPGTGSTVAANMTIKAQGVSLGTGGSPNQLGGTLVLAGGVVPTGNPTGNISGGTYGGVSLAVGGDPFQNEGQGVAFQVTQVYQNSNVEPTVAAFFPVSSFTGVTSSDIPNSAGGNNFIYVGDTVNPPSGPALTGALLWSQGGKLNIMQEDGTSFVVGSIPNPSTWGTLASNQGTTVTYRSYASSTTSAGVNVFTNPVVTIPTDTSVRVDCIFVAKVPASSTCAQYNVSMGFVNSSGTVSNVGTVTIADPRTNGTGWNAPYISFSGTSLVVTTGYNTGSAANWNVITQLTISPQQ
jgi:hypothetical protein